MKRFILIVILFFLSFTYDAFSMQEWKEDRSRHFIVFYKAISHDFAEDVLDAAEDYSNSILDEFGFSRDHLWTWDRLAKIYIYDNKNEYLNETQSSEWSGGSAELGSQIIRTYPQEKRFFDEILPHEIAHLIFYDYVGSSSTIPLWLSEGVALCQGKGSPRLRSDSKVRKAIAEERFIPLEELSSMNLDSVSDRETVDLFYAESRSLVGYLVSRMGSFDFSSFCRNLRKGLKLEEALRETADSFNTIEDLNKAWVGYLKK